MSATSTLRVRKPIGMRAAPPAEIPVIGQAINLPEPAAEAAPAPPTEPTGPVPEFKRGQAVDYWDDQMVGLVPLVATVLRPAPGQPGRYAVNVHMNGMLRFVPDAPAAAGPRKFSLTAPE